MKYLSICACAFLTFGMLASCSKKAEEKAEEPTLAVKETNVNGTLNGAYELVKEDYAIEVKGDVATATVKVKRTDVTVPYVPEYVELYSDYSSESEGVMAFAGFGYTLYDEAGKEITTVLPDKNNESKEQQMKLLTLKNGETGELKVEFDAKELPASISLTTDAIISDSFPITFEGSIDKYTVKNFEISANFNNSDVGGQYQYTTSPAGAFLYLRGSAVKATFDEKTGGFSWDLNMTEDNGQGMTTGEFIGKLVLTRDNETSPFYYTITGDFTNFQYKIFKYNLKTAPLNELIKEGNEPN